MYIALTKSVHAIIARTHLASNSLMANPNFVPALPRPETTIHYMAPSFLSVPTEGHRMKMKATSAMVIRYLEDKHPLVKGFVEMLRNHAVTKATSGPGCTWLELLILAAAHTDDISSCLFPPTSMPRPSLALLLNTFRTDALAALKHIFEGTAQELFTSSYEEPSRLRTLGISSRLLHTNCMLFLRPAAVHILASCILS